MPIKNHRPWVLRIWHLLSLSPIGQRNG